MLLFVDPAVLECMLVLRITLPLYLNPILSGGRGEEKEEKMFEFLNNKYESFEDGGIWPLLHQCKLVTAEMIQR